MLEKILEYIHAIQPPLIVLTDEAWSLLHDELRNHPQIKRDYGVPLVGRKYGGLLVVGVECVNELDLNRKLGVKNAA